MNTENTAKPRWGILDTIDNVWMGNDKGPLVYDDHEIARMAEYVVNEMMGTLARYRVREYMEEATIKRDTLKALRKRDNVIKDL